MATRADNGDGSCKQVKTGRHEGKWRVQYTLVEPTGIKRRLSKLFPRQAEGKEFLRSLRRDDQTVEGSRRRSLSLGEWVEWLAAHDWPEVLAEQTIQDRMSRFQRYVRPVFGAVPLARIDPLQVRHFYSGLRRDQVGPATIHALKRDLVRIFNQAVTPYQRVPTTLANPFRLTLPLPPTRQAVALTPEQAREALASPNLNSSRRGMLALFLLAGVRLGEQMALSREQLLFAENLIVIDRAVRVKKGGAQYVGLPKGGKKRMVVMCPSLQELLWHLTANKKPQDLVWAAAFENKPRMRKLVYATWRTIVKDAGLPETMSPHDCRLTHINWIEKLMPLVSRTTLKEHIGHAAQGVTEVNYTRPLTPAQDILRHELERLVGTSLARA